MKKENKNIQTSTLLDKIVVQYKKNPKIFLASIIACAILLTALTFDIKLSTGGDDVSYILAANDFIKKGILPVGFKSPGYPIFLSLFVMLFGMNIIALKLTSTFMFLASILSLYYLLKNKIETETFTISLVLFTINLLVIQYACHTYSEMTFLFLQLWIIFMFVYIAEKQNPSIIQIALLAIMAMIGFYVRAIGATLPIAIFLWFLIKKNIKTSLIFSAFCIMLYSPLKIAELISKKPLLSQSSLIFMVNPYNPAMGTETLEGFIQRVKDNLIIHLNYMFPKALGLPYGEHLATANGNLLPDAIAFLGLLISTVLIIGLISSLRNKNPLLSFSSLYIIVYVFGISFALQTFFATPRMMVPITPLLILMFLLGIQTLLHRFLKTENNWTHRFKKWFVALTTIIVFSNGYYDLKAIKEHLPVLKSNLSGNEYAGYTPDWVNYIKACRWIAQNLPRDSVGIICRKAEFFRIYTNDYPTYGVYSIESSDADSIITHWKTWKMTHILYDNFQWSSTLRRYVQPAFDKYPHMFEILHKEGTVYPSYVIKIKYDKPLFIKNNN